MSNVANPVNPEDQDRGEVALWFDKMLGRHWTQKLRGLCGYAFSLFLMLKGCSSISASSVDSLGVPWLARNWFHITAWADFINGLLFAAGLIGKRIGDSSNVYKEDR